MPDQIILFGLSAKELLLAGTWLVTMIGWIVTNRQANNRENRKDARAELEACCKMAAELLNKCRTYYAQEPIHQQEKCLAAEIGFELKRLIIRAERLESRYGSFDVIGACVELVDSVSGGDFESKTRKVRMPDSRKIRKIESDIHFLMNQLEDGFFNQFY
jgi:hypothetical protein